MSQIQFGNGQKIAFDYDSLDRITGKSVKNVNDTEFVKRFSYDYDENGNIALVTDNRDSSLTRYFYNLSDRLTGILDPFGYRTDFVYDNAGNVKKVNEAINGQNFSTSYDFNKDYSPTSVTYNNGNSILSYNYKDPASGKSIGRLYSKTMTVNNNSISTTTYTYKPSYITVGNASTNVIDQIENNGKKIQYDYDKNGNIKTITEAGIAISYEYNELNELIRENNPVTGNTVIYSYDAGRNIT